MPSAAFDFAESSGGGIEVEARVLSVRVLAEGRYGATLGPPPAFFYVVTGAPLKVGALVRVEGVASATVNLPDGATVTEISASRVVELGDLPARHVHAEWLDRVDLFVGELYGYQREGAAWLASRLADKRGSIIADEMGLGKSRQIIAAALAAEVLPMLIVCPYTLKRQWHEELQEAATPLEIQIIDGSEGLLHEAHVYIVHYDILKPRERQLGRLPVRLVVFDEGHLLKAPDPDRDHRASIATRLAHKIGLSVIATGTPLLNHVEEYWRLLHIVDPASWPDFESYQARYSYLPSDEELLHEPAAQKRIVTTHGRAERTEELQSRVDELLIRRTKLDALVEMSDKIPPKERRVLEVDLDPCDRAEYDRAAADVAAWYAEHGEGLRAGRIKHAEGLQRLATLRQITTMAKMRRAVPDYLSRWFGGEIARQLVVFGYHRAPLERLAHVASAMKIRAGAILGEDASAPRAAVVDAFRAGEIDLLIAPIRIAGIGLNLQNAAHALFLEWTWVPADMEQAEGRLHRIGQTRPVVIDYLAARGTIDAYMAEVIAGKQILIDSLVDGGTERHYAIESQFVEEDVDEA